MTDLLLQIAVSNVCISLALAVAALLVERIAKRPAIAHLLWLLVFVKLLTPPIVTIPVFTIPAPADTMPLDIDGPTAGVAVEADAGAFDVSPAEETNPTVWEQTEPALLLAWLFGSGFILIWSLVRVYRFDRLLRTGSETAPPELQARAARIAGRLGLRSVPTIRTTSAQLSPLVWWVGGKVRVVIPQSLLDQMDTEHSQWVLAHELAHVRRRDYLVRWLEWLACVCFWWNPLVWWGRCRLRGNEEICCDDLVLASLKPKPRTYADSLLNVIEHLASPVIRPPAVASEINSGGFLRRRFKMIVSETTNRSRSRWLQACVLLGAMLVLPVGLTYAQDFDAVERKLGEAVAEGELSLEQAVVMMEALREVAEDEQEGGINRRFGGWIGDVGGKLKAAVEAGKLSEEDAWKKWHHFKQHELGPKLKATLKAGKMSEEIARRIWHDVEMAEVGEKLKAAVAKGELTEKEAGAKWKAISKESRGDFAERPSRDEMGKVKERIWAGVKEGRITEAQAKERWGGYLKRVRGEAREKRSTKRDEGLVGHYKRMGVSVETLGKIKKALADAGVTDKQMEGTLGGMIRVVYEMKSEGDAYKMDPGLRKYFAERLRLTDKQMELVEGIARRVLHGMKESTRRGDVPERKRDEGIVGHYKRMGVSVETLDKIKKALADAGVTDKQMEGTLGGMIRVVYEMKSEGDAYKMDPGLRKYSAEQLRLTDKQIELVEGIARRVLHGMKESHRER